MYTKHKTENYSGVWPIWKSYRKSFHNVKVLFKNIKHVVYIEKILHNFIIILKKTSLNIFEQNQQVLCHIYLFMFFWPE